MTNGNRLTLLGHSRAVDLTSGPNGISRPRPAQLLRPEGASRSTAYFYVALITLAIVVIALHFIAESRTGRAWKALREDPLAAETMSIPVNRLKLLAFAFGASIAGVTGAISAAVDGAVFPDSYDTPLLITVYAMVILGGAGSLSGVILGALTINISLEVLRDPNQARWLFYAVILITLVAKVRPWKKLAADPRRRSSRSATRSTRSSAAVWPRGTKGQAAGGDADRPRGPGLGDPTGAQRDADRELRVRRADRCVLDPDAAARLVARSLPRADALPRRVRVGEPARLRAVDDAADHPRRAADRAHERAAAGAARHVAGRDRMSERRCSRCAA